MTNPCDNSGMNIRVNSAILSGALSGVPGPAGPTGCPTFNHTTTIRDVVPGRYYLFYSPTAAELKQLIVIHSGEGTASVTWNLRYGNSFTGIGTAVFSSDKTTTSTALGHRYPTEGAFVPGTAEMLSNMHVWLDVAAAAADTNMHITVLYKPECIDVLTDKGIALEQQNGTQHTLPLVDAD